jgi:hypothetical protein
MVWEHISRQAEIFHDDDDRFALRLGTMPPNTIAWLGGHTGRETFFAAAGNGSSVPGSAVELQTHVTTFAYERLVIQVLSVRPYKYANPYALIDCNQRVWGDAIVRIWPTVDKAFWPPARIIHEEMLDPFHNRCSVGHGDSPAETIE